MKKEKLSFENMIDSSVVSKENQKKKKKNLKISFNQKLTDKLHVFLDQKHKMKLAESLMRSIEQELIEYCLKRQDANAFKGEFNSSYDLVPLSGTPVKFVTVDKYNISQKSEDIDNIKKELGELLFNEEIEKVKSIALKPEVLNTPKLQRELVKLIGKRFKEFFVTVETYKMKSGFDERMYTYIKNHAQANNVRKLCGKIKPSIK